MTGIPDDYVVDPECYSRWPHRNEETRVIDDKLWCIPCYRYFYPEDEYPLPELPTDPEPEAPTEEIEEPDVPTDPVEPDEDPAG